MKSLNLSELSEQELIKKEKNLKTASGALIGIMSIFAIAVIVLFVQEQYTIALPLSSILFSLSLIMFKSKKQLSDIKTELEKKETIKI